MTAPFLLISFVCLQIDGHGNFGSVDNDPAAAMRYTECRLQQFSTATFLTDLDADTVDFTPNFDASQVNEMLHLHTTQYTSSQTRLLFAAKPCWHSACVLHNCVNALLRYICIVPAAHRHVAMSLTTSRDCNIHVLSASVLHMQGLPSFFIRL